jgi:hypothetical protein
MLSNGNLKITKLGKIPAKLQQRTPSQKSASEICCFQKSGFSDPHDAKYILGKRDQNRDKNELTFAYFIATGSGSVLPIYPDSGEPHQCGPESGTLFSV